MPGGFDEPAPAKINLALHVTGRRDDGMHLVDSLIAFAALGDTLSAAPAPADRLDVDGEFAEALPDRADNLVHSALEAFRAQWPGVGDDPLAIRLAKRVPVAAGLGGGSADAAAMLRILARMTAIAPDEGRLLAIAARLGADVPVCLVGRPSQVSGTGEIVRPVEALPEAHLVLVNPRQQLPTEAVFAGLDRRANPPLPALPGRFADFGALAGWLAATRNDLEAPATALVPEIGEIKRALGATNGCALARLAGSGPTVFGLYPSRDEAVGAARHVQNAWPDYWVAATMLDPTPPSPT